MPGVAVVVGARSTNLPDALRRSRYIDVWESTDPSTQRRQLPSNAKALIFTRFVSHALLSRLMSEAKGRDLSISYNVSTSALKDLLREFLSTAV